MLRMKIKFILVLFFSLFLLSCNEKRPVTLQDTAGHVIPLKQLADKWIIVNYWATWCESCRTEIPVFNKIYRQQKNNNVLVYGVSFNTLPLETLQVAQKKMQIQFPVLTENPAPVWHLDVGEIVPITFIIDPAGKVVEKIVGPSTEKSLTAILQKLGVVSTPAHG